MAKYKVGDFVTFHPGHTAWNGDLPPEGEEYDEWFDNQIEAITEDANYEFADFEGLWEEGIISGLSPDYIAGEDGIHDMRIDDE